MIIYIQQRQQTQHLYIGGFTMAAVTNAKIIFDQSILLAQEGIIGWMPDGMPEPIHTYQAWKARGYQVRKGEKCIAQFTIWKYGKKKITKDDGQEVETGKCFMKLSSFFKASQVDKIEKAG